jgi:hypothetical protein
MGHSLKSAKLFLYSREPIGIALELIKHKASAITYITDEIYETVLAERVEQEPAQPSHHSSF